MSYRDCALAIWLVSTASFAAPAGVGQSFMDLAKSKTQVGFLAIGNPSALRIRGESKKENAIEGRFMLAGTRLTGKVSLSLDDLQTGIAMRDRHMKEKYLEVAKYPKAELTRLNLTLPAPTAYELKAIPFAASLVLHGVEKPVAGVVDVVRNESRLLLDFRFDMKTSDFAISTPTFMGITVGDAVNVTAHVEGSLAPESARL
jgi:polyisoprenoid-binding protein YceI